MRYVHAKAAALVPASADRIYAVLRDYRSAHAHILPTPPFSGIEVEQGGTGAGTIFRTTVRSLGSEQQYRMAVTEPQPGRVLVESDLHTDLVTTFTITPTEDPTHTQVQIATRWAAKAGLAGWVDSWLTPVVMHLIYRKELRQLAAYVAVP